MQIFATVNLRRAFQQPQQFLENVYWTLSVDKPYFFLQNWINYWRKLDLLFLHLRYHAPKAEETLKVKKIQVKWRAGQVCTIYRSVISLQSQGTYFFGIGSCEKCLHPLCEHKNRLQAAFPFSQRQKRAQYNIGEFGSRTQKLSPKLLGISFASGWRGKSKSDNNAIRSRRAPRNPC